MDHKVDIGSFIREERLKQGLSRKRLSELSGVSESAIKQYETNKRRPRVDLIQKILSALNIEESYFLSATSLPKEERIQIIMEARNIDAHEAAEVINNLNAASEALNKIPFISMLIDGFPYFDKDIQDKVLLIADAVLNNKNNNSSNNDQERSATDGTSPE